MHPSEQVDAYLNEVLAHVRWKRAHETIRADLAAHIEDAAAAALTQGASPGEAYGRAVLEMGDPAEIGMRLDASYRPRDVRGMLIPLGILVLLGVLCRVFLYNMNDGEQEWLRFAAAVLLGGGCFALLYGANLYALIRWAPALYGACVAVLTALLALQVLWALDAALYLLLFLPLLLAGMVYATRAKEMKALLLCAASFLPVLALLFYYLQNDRAVVLALVLSAVLAAAALLGVYGKRRLAPLAVGLAPAAGAALWNALFAQHYLARLLSGETSLSDFFAQRGLNQGIIILWKNAQPFGSGAELMDALRKAFSGAWLTDNYDHAINNYMLVAAAQKYGWVPVTLIVLALFVFIALGILRALRQSSAFGRLTGVAVMVAFATQTFTYLLANLGLVIGGRGLPLPFVSYGNTALVLNFALAGLLFSLFRTDGLYADKPAETIPKLHIRLDWAR